MVMRRGWIKGFDVPERCFTERSTTVLDTVTVTGPEGVTHVPARWRDELSGDGVRAVIDGDVEYGSVMAGQSVGMVHVERPVVDIIAKLMDEANAALAR